MSGVEHVSASCVTDTKPIGRAKCDPHRQILIHRYPTSSHKRGRLMEVRGCPFSTHLGTKHHPVVTPGRDILLKQHFEVISCSLPFPRVSHLPSDTSNFALHVSSHLHHSPPPFHFQPDFATPPTPLSVRPPGASPSPDRAGRADGTRRSSVARGSPSKQRVPSSPPSSTLGIAGCWGWNSV